MNNFLSKIKRLFNRLTAFIPTPIPVGVTAFNAWVASIIDTYELPKEDATKFAIAAMVLHLDATSSYKPKRYFGLAGRKGMANQIAHAIMMDLKRQQEERNKINKPAEATALTVVASNDQPVQNV